MRYMLLISKGSKLETYTGVIHETKAEALEEYLEAVNEYGRKNVFLIIL